MNLLRSIEPVKSYKRTKTAIFGFLILYFFGGLATLALPEREIFPVYSWFLFALVPQNDPRFELWILETHEGELSHPCPWNRAGGIVRDPHSITAYHLTQALGRAIEQQDAVLIAELRARIETHFIQAPIRYRVVRSLYHPISRWRTGEADHESMVEFQYPQLALP